MTTAAPPHADVDPSSIPDDWRPLCEGLFYDEDACPHLAAWALVKPCSCEPTVLLLCDAHAEMFRRMAANNDVTCLTCGTPADPNLRPL